MNWIHNDFACQECRGTGDCLCCGSEGGCDECNGTGIDEQLVDVSAFNEACKALNAESQKIGHIALSWSLVDKESGKTIGRTNGKRDVKLADFVREDEELFA
jgi:hypothetical protein